MFSKELKVDDVRICSCGCKQVMILIESYEPYNHTGWRVWWGEPGIWWRELHVETADVRSHKVHPDPEGVRVQFTVDALEGKLDA